MCMYDDYSILLDSLQEMGMRGIDMIESILCWDTPNKDPWTMIIMLTIQIIHKSCSLFRGISMIWVLI